MAIMNDFILNLDQRLNAQITAIEQSRQSDLLKSKDAVQCLVKGLRELKAFILNHHFPDHTQEIQFFKETKPNYISRLLYHMQVCNIKTHCPKGTRSNQESYYQNELSKIESFQSAHFDFYIYYKTGSTHLDHTYFVRSDNIPIPYDESLITFLDPGFSTSHDHLLAKLIAYDQLGDFLTHQIDTLYNPPPQIEPDTVQPIHWTASKTDLVELIYALYAAGAINTANAR